MSVGEGHEKTCDRFRLFLETEPVVALLNRNLSFLLPENSAVSSLQVNDSLKCFTRGSTVTVGGADYLLREEFDRRHWLAGLRMLLAHEVQHDSSSDKLCLAALRDFFGEYFFRDHGLDPSVGRLIAHKTLNLLEDARVNTIICQRFPGYVPMLRFVCFVRADSPRFPEGGLGGFFNALECFALTGLMPEGFDDACLKRAAPLVDRAALAETSAECGELCKALLMDCAGHIAALCRGEPQLSELLSLLSDTLEDYAFSDADRLEQHGDGSDNRLRRKETPEELQRKGAADEADEAEGDRADDGSPGSGDNSLRKGDMSGSLTGEDAKPKGSAGTYGREDRGVSTSAGSSSNHGRSSSLGIKSDGESALSKAGLEGPVSISEVLGTGYSRRRGLALSERELETMLQNAGDELLRETQQERRSFVKAATPSRLSLDNKSSLSAEYQKVRFEESSITPGTGHLPPEYAEAAKELHRKLEKILRQQRERSSGQRKGALSQKDLWKTQIDAKDVFRRKSPPNRRETAFCLLIDRSGSMGMGVGNGNSKLFTALMTAAVIEEALKGVAYTKITAFDGGLDTVAHCAIKDYEQKELGNRCFDAVTQISAGNGNMDGYSIRVSAMDMVKRSEKRKVLVVLSDGLPSAYYSESEAVADVRAAVQDARRRGIIVIPVIYGVDSESSLDSYRQMYEKSIILASSASILGEFEKLLIKLVR